jgi:hypothetical protein
VYSSCLKHTFMIWSPVRELAYGPRSFIAASSEAGQTAAFDYVPIFSKNCLHLAGRPQMSTRPSVMGPMRSSPPCDRNAAELTLLPVVDAKAATARAAAPGGHILSNRRLVADK